MNQMQKIAREIPHEYRVKILMIWLKYAKVNWQSEEFKNLWNAYFIYIEPDGVPKTSCPICMQNVYESWWKMHKYLVEAEQEYNLIESL